MKTQVKSSKYQKYWTPVPNNPRDNQLYFDKKEMDKEKKIKNMMLFDKTEDVLKRVVSKHEPGEPRRTEYLKVDKDKYNKDMEFWKKRNQQASARERLKRKGAVPTRSSGKKLFEDFCKEAYKNRTQQTNINDADLKNIYNAATQLDFDRWSWWIMNEYRK